MQTVHVTVPSDWGTGVGAASGFCIWFKWHSKPIGMMVSPADWCGEVGEHSGE